MVSERGDIYVAEDVGNMELVTILANGNIQPLLQVVDQDHSKITGPPLILAALVCTVALNVGPVEGYSIT